MLGNIFFDATSMWQRNLLSNRL